MKKEALSIIIVLILSISGCFAQNVSRVSFEQKGYNIIISYDITESKFNEKMNIEVYLSTDGGASFSGPLQKVSGDVGINVRAGKNKKIYWAVFEEYPTLEGDIVFDVRGIVTKDRIPKKPYIGYRGSIHAPIGFVIGKTGKTGYYFSTRFSSGLLHIADYHTNGDLVIDYNQQGYYSFTGRDLNRWVSVTGGLQFQTSNYLHWYIGAGYTQYNLLWEIKNYKYPVEYVNESWVINNQESFSGTELEAGLLYTYHSIFFSVGLSTKNLKQTDGNIGLGYVF